ncbi:MAG: hypothetical protein ACI4JC_02250 [Faecalibacterium sp.]
MMKKVRAAADLEDGMEAIEGLLVITLTLFVVFYIWAFGFLLYQRWAVVYVANDAASRIAQTYAYPGSDPITGFVSSSSLAGLSPYRYLNDEINRSNADRAQKYTSYLLKRNGFSQAHGVNVTVETVYDTLAQRHIEVTVTATYEIPFGFAMKIFGQSPYRTFQATGRAVCLDVKNYIYTVKTVDAFGDTVGNGVDSKFIKAVEKSISLIKSLSSFMENVFP